jgi:hypothetical protein
MPAKICMTVLQHSADFAHEQGNSGSFSGIGSLYSIKPSDGIQDTWKQPRCPETEKVRAAQLAHNEIRERIFGIFNELCWQDTTISVPHLRVAVLGLGLAEQIL